MNWEIITKPIIKESIEYTYSGWIHKILCLIGVSEPHEFKTYKITAEFQQTYIEGILISEEVIKKEK